MSISLVTNEDNMLMMARYPDKFFDLAIVDPPYGIGMDGKNNWSGSKHELKSWDNEPPSKEYIQQLLRVSKNCIIWGANHFIQNIKQSNSSCWIIWDKANDGFSFADAELAWTNFETAIRFFRYHRGKQTDKRIHPTQKPKALYTWLLQKYAKAESKILDTHLGSGSSRIAAYDLGFDFYGCELDKDYFDAQEKRFNIHISQQRLFTPNKELPEQSKMFI